MASYIRPKVPGATVFFTVCLERRGATLLLDELPRLRRAVAETLARHPFRIDAFVVLPDHLHAIWTLPPGDSDFGTRWGSIKSKFSRAALKARGWPKDRSIVFGDGVGWNPTLRDRHRCRRVGLHPTAPVDARSPSKIRKGDAGIWQRRFWEHHIRDAADLDTHLRYCWWNPVKHGLVARPTDWAASSIHRDIRAGRVEPEWAGGCPEGEFGEAA